MTGLLTAWLQSTISVGLAVVIISWVYILFDSYYGTSDLKREVVIAIVCGLMLAIADRVLGTYLDHWIHQAKAFYALGALIVFSVYWLTHRDDLEESDATYLILVWIPCQILVGFLFRGSSGG